MTFVLFLFIFLYSRQVFIALLFIYQKAGIESRPKEVKETVVESFKTFIHTNVGQTDSLYKMLM